MNRSRRIITASIGFGLLAPVRAVFCQVGALDWKPMLRFDGELFPSFVLANATRSSSGSAPPNVFGDRLTSVGVVVKAPKAEVRIRAVISIDGIGGMGAIEQVLPVQGQEYVLLPKLRYDFAALTRLVQPTATSIRYQLFADDVKVIDDIQTVRVRSVNDAPISTFRNGRPTGNYEYMFAAYVNENHPLLEQILQGALRLPQPVVKSFSGYQEPVIPQIFAIWYFLQRSGFAYTSITTPSAMADGVFSQHVRFVEDSVRARQANCLDGTVLFASVLRKIGIDPVLVLIPGHAFLGFYIDQQHQQIAFLETTRMTSTNPFVNRAPSVVGTQLARLFRTDPRMAESAAAFDGAMDAARQTYAKAEAGINSKAPHYALIDIDKARRAGVQPISR